MVNPVLTEAQRADIIAKVMRRRAINVEIRERRAAAAVIRQRIKELQRERETIPTNVEMARRNGVVPTTIAVMASYVYKTVNPLDREAAELRRGA
jgi:hypothetical protein